MSAHVRVGARARLRGLGLLVACLWPECSLAQPPDVVARHDVLDAMRASRGFDPTATTNGARFQADVLFELARRARRERPQGGPLLVRHDDWFAAFLERTQRTAATAPTFVRLAFQHRQDIEVEYRWDRVVERVVKGPAPTMALAVRIGWPAASGAPERYSYVDALSTPHLQVTNERVMAYRLVDLRGVVVFDAIEGLRGRPTSGVLGALFQLIGEGRVEQNRMAVAADGVQVARARCTKAFLAVTTTVTVWPDGRTEKNVPPRADLRRLEERLDQPFEVTYRRWP